MTNFANLEAVNILKNALWHLRTYGWKQGSAGYYGGPSCIIGAITEVAHRMRPPSYYDDGLTSCFASTMAGSKAESIAIYALKFEAPLHDIVAYNDDPNRTFSDIEELFERAIAKLESPES